MTAPFERFNPAEVPWGADISDQLEAFGDGGPERFLVNVESARQLGLLGAAEVDSTLGEFRERLGVPPQSMGADRVNPFPEGQIPSSPNDVYYAPALTTHLETPFNLPQIEKRLDRCGIDPEKILFVRNDVWQLGEGGNDSRMNHRSNVWTPKQNSLSTTRDMDGVPLDICRHSQIAVVSDKLGRFRPKDIQAICVSVRDNLRRPWDFRCVDLLESRIWRDVMSTEQYLVDYESFGDSSGSPESLLVTPIGEGIDADNTELFYRDRPVTIVHRTTNYGKPAWKIDGEYAGLLRLGNELEIRPK